MDTTKTEKDPLTIEHISWLGLTNKQGAFVREGLNGEVQYIDKRFYYCEKNEIVKELNTEKDLNDLIIPILNKELQKRNEKLRNSR